MKKLMTEWRNFQKVHKVNEKMMLLSNTHPDLSTLTSPGVFWKEIAEYWNTTEAAAKKSNCGNCTAFDISPRWTIVCQA